MTIEQFAIKVLSKLGVWDRGSLSAEDLQNVSDAYNSVYLELKDDGIVTWGASEDIPERFVLSLTTIVAAEIADFYKIPEATTSRLIIQSASAKHMIRRQLASGQEQPPVEAEYY